MNANNKQTKFLDIKNKLKDSVQRLFDIPDYGQVDLNLVNMANFFPILQEIVDAVHPKIICEIGSDQGMTSDLLYQYCKSTGAHLHVVDPILEDNRQSDKTVTYFREMSLSYLQKAGPADVYFIDGDHNFYTVLNELRLIREMNSKGSPRFLFLHDVGWPWGYMDMYYDINSVEEKYRKKATASLNLSLFRSEYATGKQGLSMEDAFVAIDDGGEENGVLAAVEKFLEESSGWKYFSIPSIFGLGVLWYGNETTQEIAQKVERLSEEFGKFSSFLSILEFNRILLLEKVQETGEIWSQQNEYINLLEEKSVLHGREWKEQNDYIKRLEEKDIVHACELKEQKDLVQAQSRQIMELQASCKVLEENCASQGREWEAQRDYITELIRRNVDLDLKIMELEGLWGMSRNILKKIIVWVKKGFNNS